MEWSKINRKKSETRAKGIFLLHTFQEVINFNKINSKSCVSKALSRLINMLFLKKMLGVRYTEAIFSLQYLYCII